MAPLNTQGHEKHIRIRPYRASDFEQVRELFKVGILHGSNSPLKAGYITQLKGPTAYLSYCVFLLGLEVLLVTSLTSSQIHYIGIGLCITGCALFATLRLRLFSVFSDHVEKALNSDLKDIDKTYGMELTFNHNDESIGEYIPRGSNGFWVAEAYEKGSEVYNTEVIGYVGIDVNQSPDKTSAELRRMVVSPNYRRRNVATSLILVALQHARNHGVTSVSLTTSMFQPAAIAMYEKFGWVRQKKVGVRVVLDMVWILFYSLDLTTAKV